MHDIVTPILVQPATLRIDFQFQGHHVGFASFQAVIGGLAEGKITVEHDPSTTMAHYHIAGNKFLLPYDSQPQFLIEEALVVHEAVHAAMDISKAKVTRDISETTAYLAQAIYVYNQMGRSFEPNWAGWPFGEGMLKTAFGASRKAHGRCAILTMEDVKPLYDAVCDHKEYKDNISAVVPYNGI